MAHILGIQEPEKLKNQVDVRVETYSGRISRTNPLHFVIPAVFICHPPHKDLQSSVIMRLLDGDE